MRISRWTFRLLWLAPLVVLGLWSIAIEPARLVVREAAIRASQWPKAAAPLRVAVVGDIHAGAPHIDESKLDAVVDTINAARPDAVFLLGDFVIHGVTGGRFMDPEVLARHLARLQAPLGRFAVLGNHDWWWDGERVRRALAGAGLTVLENQSARLERAGGDVYVIGLADAWTRNPDVSTPLRGVPLGAPVVVLIHEPDVFPDMPERVAVTFAAHTHGGQVRVPILGAPIVPSKFGQRYAAGHVVEEGRHLFVTTGVGTSIIPVRFRVPPEIAIVTVGAIDAVIQQTK